MTKRNIKVNDLNKTNKHLSYIYYHLTMEFNIWTRNKVGKIIDIA